MTATMPTRIVRPTSNSAPQLLIIESSGGTHVPPPTPRLTIGQRVAGLVGTVVAVIALLVLGIVGAAFTAVWVVVTLLAGAVRRGRSGPIVLRPATTRPDSETHPSRAR